MARRRGTAGKNLDKSGRAEVTTVPCHTCHVTRDDEACQSTAIETRGGRAIGCGTVGATLTAATVIGPHVPADFRSPAYRPLLRLVHVARQGLQRRALHAMVCEARVVVAPFLGRGGSPGRAAGQAAGVGDGRVPRRSPRVVAVDVVLGVTETPEKLTKCGLIFSHWIRDVFWLGPQHQLLRCWDPIA